MQRYRAAFKTEKSCLQWSLNFTQGFLNETQILQTGFLLHPQTNLYTKWFYSSFFFPFLCFFEWCPTNSICWGVERLLHNTSTIRVNSVHGFRLSGVAANLMIFHHCHEGVPLPPPLPPLLLLVIILFVRGVVNIIIDYLLVDHRRSHHFMNIN